MSLLAICICLPQIKCLGRVSVGYCRGSAVRERINPIPRIITMKSKPTFVCLLVCLLDCLF